jgi:hypothetical protein
MHPPIEAHLDERLTGMKTLTNDHAKRLLDAELKLERMHNGSKIALADQRYQGTMSKAEARALMDAHQIKSPLFMDPEEILRLMENNPTLLKGYVALELIAKYGNPENSMHPYVEIESVEPRPICTLTLTKAQAQALCDEYGILDEDTQQDIQRLQKTNPALLQAHQVIYCLRQYGKP